MEDFAGKLAVITGGGTGMGRELAIQLSGSGCSVALCDVSEAAMDETRRLCGTTAKADAKTTAHRCDVAVESEVEAFRDAALSEHASDHLNLLFNNAGISGGGSFVAGDRVEWDRVFNICWGGVYHCSRAFMPALVASDSACIINTSSVNGFWASLGPDTPHTAYSSAKFAVKGFSEALLADLRIHAPHVKVALVMPGHVGTEIAANSVAGPGGEGIASERLAQIRLTMERQGLAHEGLDDDTLRQFIEQRTRDFRDNAPLSAADAATQILDGVRAGRWRILVGDDAEAIDRLVRQDPEAAYAPDFLKRLQAEGHMTGGLG